MTSLFQNLPLPGLGAADVARLPSAVPPRDAAATFLVPTTLIIQPQPPAASPTAVASISPLAWQVLPGADYDDFFVPRSEKFIYGSIPLQQISAYTVLLYDEQRISSPRGSGYRYTWAVREGVFYP